MHSFLSMLLARIRNLENKSGPTPATSVQLRKLARGLSHQVRSLIIHTISNGGLDHLLCLRIEAGDSILLGIPESSRLGVRDLVQKRVSEVKCKILSLARRIVLGMDASVQENGFDSHHLAMYTAVAGLI